MSDEPLSTSLLLEDVVDWCPVVAAVGVAQQSHVLLAPLAAAEATEINVLIPLISKIWGFLRPSPLSVDVMCECPLPLSPSNKYKDMEAPLRSAGVSLVAHI